MPARDIFHDTVKRALIKEDWVITHDPFWIKLVDSDINVYVDLAAERILAAEKAGQKNCHRNQKLYRNLIHG